MQVLLKNSLLVFVLLLSNVVFGQDNSYDLKVYVSGNNTTKITLMDDIKNSTCLKCKSKPYGEFYVGPEINILKTKDNVESCIIQVILENDDIYRFKLIFTDKEEVTTNYNLSTKKLLKELQSKQAGETSPGYEANSEKTFATESNSNANTVSNKNNRDESKFTDDFTEEKELNNEEISSQITSIITKMGNNDQNLKTQVENLIHNFQTYCNFLADKSKNSDVEINKAAARKLFYKPDQAIIQVVNKGIVDYRTLEVYFSKILQLRNKYKEFIYKEKNVQILGKPRETNEQGVYKVIAVYTQEFSAVQKDREGIEHLLKSNTTKFVEIIIKVHKKIDKGEIKYEWTAYLQNISANKSE